MKTIISSLAIISLALLSCNHSNSNEKTAAKQESPINVIFMIGDGMGISQITTMFYYKESESQFNHFQEIGFINTSSATNKVTDSAAAGTAFATGQKTFNRGIGLDIDSLPLPSIVSILQQRGYQTGLVSISSVTHATPASFYAQVVDRDMEETIAQQLVSANIDFIAGGGLKFFNKRADGHNLLENLTASRYIIDTLDISPIENKSDKYAYIVADNGLPQKHKGRGDFLKDATKQALTKLSASENGFFLMVEGSYIDWAGHARDEEFLIAEMLDFEDAMAVAIEFTKQNPNTLLIVTGDHETGGVSVGKGNSKDEVKIYFNTDQHTADLVPVFAKGPGSDLFKGFYHNKDIYHKIIEALTE
ncbi:alkaline phosphatase [Alkaliflexus imshenetskii]|uniref:alkaline phosphatase n=1 Tax=Alkaliflexus imshenetskii TaxID=286730 RepID=UPI000479568E|nr:alkaline phosphatase [Alkaliflexus imshenetskii]